MLSICIYILLFHEVDDEIKYPNFVPPKYNEVDLYDGCLGFRMFSNKSCINRCSKSALQGIISLPTTFQYEISDLLSCHVCPQPPPYKEAIWKWMESFQFNITNRKSWGRVLDAGTGTSSMKFLTSLETEEITAITNSDLIKTMLHKFDIRDQDTIIHGDWTKIKSFPDLKGKVFDVVLADYLVGSMEFNSPFYQDTLFEILHPFVGDLLYVIGQEPYRLPSDMAGEHIETKQKDFYPAEYVARKLAMNIFKYRDSTAIFSNERFYREYPIDWVVRTLKKSNFTIVKVIMFPILFGKEALEKQLENADGSLKRGYYKDILMDQKINQEAIRDFEGYYNHFKRQLEKKTN